MTMPLKSLKFTDYYLAVFSFREQRKTTVVTRVATVS